MRVIFLDVDGVLNNANTEVAVAGGYAGVDPVNADILAALVRKAGALLVLTSTWKDNWFRDPAKKRGQDEFADALDAALAERGIYILDKTQDDTLDRGAGIVRWLREHPDLPITSFVILDDQPFDYRETGLAERLVQTDPAEGLTLRDAARAVLLLQGAPQIPVDPYYTAAVRAALRADEFSTALLQRALGLGYGEVTALIDKMLAAGVIERVGDTAPARYRARRKEDQSK